MVQRDPAGLDSFLLANSALRALEVDASRSYPDRFDRGGRLALAVALLVGWAADALFAPTSTLLVALLTALLGGSILLNVFKEEIPSGRRSSFPWFLTGLMVYAALLAVVTAMGGDAHLAVR